MAEIFLIEDQFEWDEVSSTLSDEPELAIDTESNSYIAIVSVLVSYK